MTKMYLFSREGRDDDYIAVKGNEIVVHSSLLKNKWINAEYFGDFDRYHHYTFESYYGVDANSILPECTLIWETN